MSNSASSGNSFLLNASLANSRNDKITSRGDNGAPTALAGQASWQRPHLVQASKCNNDFHVKSSIFFQPASTCSSGTFGKRRPAISSRNISDAAAVNICLTLVYGIKAMNANASMPWNHHNPVRKTPAASGLIPMPFIIVASKAPTGDHIRTSQTLAVSLSHTKRVASKTKPVTLIIISVHKNAQSSRR